MYVFNYTDYLYVIKVTTDLLVDSGKCTLKDFAGFNGNTPLGA